MVIAVAVVVGGFGIGSAWRPVRAQTTRSDDVLPALLVEVKGLRAAMEQMASGGAQAQLLVGRLQLQEGRITSMIRRLDTVRDSLATARREYDQMRGAMQMFEKESKANAEPDNAKDMEGVFAGLKTQVVAAKANLDRLSAEEMQLTGDIANEQARWIAINQRLDELEKLIAKR
jgi:hypothetical protein